ncbi:beta-ketoacyl synthase chain length factor [Litorilituus sediminis]|uniref:3-oxoacyl-ACP synthase n=1 Tax=Litorilituus sediminis TaxID=718192 RepID=A0A4P6PBE9_9GAMM|nr:beta-ketoacyl synthase chain length factor [Litorilituus sediminis]QBG37012.1 3-oxoacyl-ACP synthase [Litorilituus sediminis]
MRFTIKKCVAWGGGLTTAQDWQAFAQHEQSLSQTQELPALKQMPAMQRRRLSPFAKLSLHCALEAADDCLTTVPSVFASRHGDLAKTSKLISDVASKEVLSPTQFGLSVHNAVGGLFSIYTGNKAPMSAVSAGEDTFFTALLDALCKLNSNDYKQILLVFTETKVPEIYQQYIQQDELDIACALLIESEQESHHQSQQTVFELAIEEKIPQENSAEANESARMQVLDFLAFYYSDNLQTLVESKRHLWRLARIADQK